MNVLEKLQEYSRKAAETFQKSSKMHFLIRLKGQQPISTARMKNARIRTSWETLEIPLVYYKSIRVTHFWHSRDIAENLVEPAKSSLREFQMHLHNVLWKSQDHPWSISKIVLEYSRNVLEIFLE